MTIYGVTAQGFIPKRLADVKQELDDDCRDTFGAAINVEAEAPLGQLNGIFSERLASLWELGELVFNSAFPDTATGVALINSGAYLGLTPKNPSKSVVSATLTGTPGTVITAGSVASVVGSPSSRFQTDFDYTIPGGGSIAAALTAQTAGAVAAPSGSLTVIETPISGWTGITNALDATVGLATESSADFRKRYAASKQKAGAGTVEAIRSDILGLTGVSACRVFENDTSFTDVHSRPPKSFEVVVEGGDDDDIAINIWQDKPAGIQTYGSTTTQITDSQGFTHDISYSRPTLITIWVEIDITTTSAFPVDGAAQAQAAVLAYGDSLTLGDDVIVTPALTSALAGIPGITGLVVRIGTAIHPMLSANIAVDDFERAKFDSSRIGITIL